MIVSTSINKPVCLIRIRLLLILLFSTISGVCFAQTTDSDLKFIEHLINKGDFKEVLWLMKRDSAGHSKPTQDSIFYFKGWAYYSLKELDKSTKALLKVGEASPFYLKSRFFAGYNLAFLQQYQSSEDIFNGAATLNEPYKSLADFELCGVDMLQGNWQDAKSRLQNLNPDVAVINHQITALTQIISEHEKHHTKSPVLAGIMSGIVPGSGKIYAGKTGQGIASFLATAGFGLVTWENYHKLGIKNAKTIFFGGIFVANYVSNIYGSVISVKVIENEYNNTIHNQVLFQLHIPLRNVFQE
jgi:hypothetical protein